MQYYTTLYNYIKNITLVLIKVHFIYKVNWINFKLMYNYNMWG